MGKVSLSPKLIVLGQALVMLLLAPEIMSSTTTLPTTLPQSSTTSSTTLISSTTTLPTTGTQESVTPIYLFTISITYTLNLHQLGFVLITIIKKYKTSSVCYTNGTVTINTTTLKDLYAAYAVDIQPSAMNLTISQPSNPQCYANLTSLPATIITLQHCEYGEPFYFYLMKEADIIGGKLFHEYSITCKIPNSGMVVYASVSGDTSDNVPPYELSYSPDFKINATISTNPAKLGERDTLTIVSVESEPYGPPVYLLPVNLSANDGGTRSKTVLEDGYTTDPDLFGNFTVEKNWAQANFSAFNFPGSDTVYFNITVRVCTDLTCNVRLKGNPSLDGWCMLCIVSLPSDSS